MSITQGGPGFPIFAEAVFTYISTGKTANYNIATQDLPPGIMCLVEQVILNNAESSSLVA